MQIGLVGKPNVGKSTFFSAATLAKAEIASYPFTTIDANKGVSYVRVPCPHTSFKKSCDPRNSKCKDGIRYLPIETIDVAGLVPEAHKGRGLGNKFLDDLRQADALIHIVDAAGSTDFEGNPCDVGTHDPMEDVLFLEREITYWILGIIEKDWKKLVRTGEKLESMMSKRLTGLGITAPKIKLSLTGLPDDAKDWTDETLLQFATKLRKIGKPMLIAANKTDIAPSENIEKLKQLDYIVISTSAESELALRRAAETNLVEYDPGASEFAIINEDKLSGGQLKALEFIRGVLAKYHSTGIQQCIEETVFKLLELIVVYPVEDEHKWTDKDGNVLPDAYLVPKASTAKELAYKVHTDLGNKFIRAINSRTGMVIGHDHKLEDGDVIKIVAGR